MQQNQNKDKKRNKSKNNKFINFLLDIWSRLLLIFSHLFTRLKIILDPILRRLSQLWSKIKVQLKPYTDSVSSFTSKQKENFEQTKAGKFIEKNKPGKTMRNMLIILIIFFGIIFIYKTVMGYFIMQYIKKSSQFAVTVSAMEVKYQEWLPELKSSGSLRAVKGVTVTTEIAGLVRKINFQPGNNVQQDELLVELNSDTEKAQLASLIASYNLAKITLERDQTLYEQAAVSKSTLDTSLAQFQSAEAQVQQEQTIIAKKNISAPFAGRLGISMINPGQYLNPGDQIVTLQSLDPIYLDFYVPQQFIKQIELKSVVKFTTNTYPGKTFEGIITTINPIVEIKTRNVEVEATVENPDHLLYPGMFGNVTINIGKSEKYLTLPQTAVVYNPYGNIVFLVEKHKETEKNKKDKKEVYTVKQVFVETGERRGNQVAIIRGIKEGDTVVTSGQMKLKNGSQVIINNNIEPNFEANPDVIEEE